MSKNANKEENKRFTPPQSISQHHARRKVNPDILHTKQNVIEPVEENKMENDIYPQVRKEPQRLRLGRANLTVSVL